jgi:tripartite-type tricarboxylate transporter receptor subunit TctC
MAMPEIKARMLDLGMDPIADNSAEEMAAAMQNDSARWSKLAEKAGLTP